MNYPSMTARRRNLAAHSIEQVGAQLRAMMPLDCQEQAGRPEPQLDCQRRGPGQRHGDAKATSVAFWLPARRFCSLASTAHPWCNPEYY